jgi:glutaconyl-CoA/methylmalonyl-CoA decarboxylase subunit gamma
MKKYVIKLNDKVYEVEMEEVTAETSAAYTETVKSAPKAAPAPAPAAAPVSGGQKIDAPMPGTILNVAVKAGDTIKKGQLLVVLEAMKMENEIVSPVDGKITSVGVTKGDSVNTGDFLVQIA